MENETPIQHCRNCDFPLPETANFCPNCSQKNHDGRLTFRKLVAETMSTVLNIDNQTYSTLKALAIPGKLTTDYFAGKHIRYYRPIRLFFFTGALLIAMISIRVGSGPSQIMPQSYKEVQTLHQKHKFYLQLDSLKKSTAATLHNRSALAALDTLMAKLDSSYMTSEHDSLSFARSFYHDSQDTIYHEGAVNLSLKEAKTINIAVDDLDNMSEDSLLQTYGITSFWQKLLVRQQIKLHKKGDNFIFYLLGNTLWMMLFMMPMLALVLKLLYIRRHYLYFEHLIFSFHAHSFQFLLFTFVLLFRNWLGDALGPLFGFASLAALLYTLLALKRFYRQGWIKTIVKYIIISMLYLFIFIMAILGLALTSFALF